MLYEKELIYEIIGSAIQVHNELGTGFLEKVYENALMVALNEKKIKATSQCPLSVYFHGFQVGEYFADLIVEDKVIVELKASEELHNNHRAQLLNYLKATGTKVGLLINFGCEKLEYERFVY